MMTSAVHVAGADLSLQTAARLMSENGVSALPVMDGDGHVIGLLSEADLLPGAHHRNGSGERPSIGRRPPRGSAQPWTVGEAMSAPVVTITPGASVGRPPN